MSELDLLIKENRTALATLEVKREGKAPLAGEEVVIAQKSTSFSLAAAASF